MRVNRSDTNVSPNGPKDNHRMRLEAIGAVWWNGGAGSMPVGKFDLAFAPQIKQFNGNSTVQLKVLDWRAA